MPSVLSVQSFIGDVSIVSKGKSGVPSLKDILSADDQIITGKSGVIDLLFNNDGVIRISGGSDVKVSGLLASKGAGSAELSLSKGSVFVVVSKLSKESKFSVKTQTAVAAVRGTCFKVASEDGKSSIEVITGKMEVSPVSNGVVIENASVVVEEKSSVSVDVKTADAAGKDPSALKVVAMTKEEVASVVNDAAAVMPLDFPANAKPEAVQELNAVKGTVENPAAPEVKGSAEKDAAEAKMKKEQADRREKEASDAKKMKEDAEKLAKETAERERLAAEQKAKVEAEKKQKQKEDRVQNVPSI